MATRYALGRREGITEELVAAIRDYESGPFSDHHAVDGALWDDLRSRFTDDELLELTWVLAEFIALGKVIYVLGIRHGGHVHA